MELVKTENRNPRHLSFRVPELTIMLKDMRMAMGEKKIDLINYTDQPYGYCTGTPASDIG